MSKETDKIIGILLGILGGLVLAELLKNLLQKRCPHCNNVNELNRDYCKFCGGSLR
jgi:hypothetical protein